MKFREADMRAALEVMKLMRDNSEDLFRLLADIEFAKKIAQIIAAARKEENP